MKPHLGLAGVIGSCAASVLISQATVASAAEIQSVQVSDSGAGITLTLESSNGEERPQIFTVSRGNTLVADMINTSLSLPGGNAFMQDNPAPGIESISVTQLDENSVRISVDGTDGAPVGQVQQEDGVIVFNFSIDGSSASATSPQLTSPEPSASPDILDSPEPIIVPEPETQISQASEVPPFPEDSDVLVPDPTVRIDGNSVSQRLIRPAVPPTQPRAMAPPVGDIATATIDVSPSTLELGTQELIPRLVLRDAPVREVLALLARAAGLNLAYTGEGPEGEEEEVRISLDIENEPIEDVFNYVIRLSGIQASRFGRTIFAGPRLPNSARDVIARSIRLNQVDVVSALQFLVAMGAEVSVSQERQVTVVDAVAVNEGGDALTQTQTFVEPQVTTLRTEYTDSSPILRGLVAVGDQRTNSMTLIGEPRLVQTAIEQLIPLDVRRRQVAVNVRVIDVDLNAVERFSSSFSFGIDDTRIINSNGVGLINFDEDSPAEALNLTPTTIGDDVLGDFILQESEVFEGVVERVNLDVGFPDPDAFAFTSDFLAQLQFAVTNGSAKILTDPTLVVQEGQTAEVILAQEVITNVEIETEGTGDERTQTVTVETEPAGVILQVQVDRIDDNGFVTLSVAPTVSAPGAVEAVEVEGAEINLTLLAERRLTSGQLRIRDGQTLILSGIIQDSDRVEITKFPILGDLPIIGALFRRTNRTNERNEVIVVMTTEILDDSEFSTFGYSLDGLSPDSQQLLRE